MSDDQYKKLMRRFTITWWLFGIVLIILAIMYFSQPTPQVNNFVGEKGEPGESVKGADAVVDYGLIETMIQQKVDQIPKPLDGKDGEAGKDGRDGADGKDGQDGAAGAPGREPELQYNPETKAIEKRYSNDRFWQVLLPLCEITNSCEAEDGPVAN